MDQFIGSRLVKELDLGLGGALFGGRMLEMAAEHGAIHAMKCSGAAHLVGYRFDELVLSRPVRVGEIVAFFGSEPTFGTSSVVFQLTALVNDEVALSTRCVYVAVGPDGRKQALPSRGE